MKYIKYQLRVRADVGTEQVCRIMSVKLPWSPENEALAEREAYQDTITLEDDGNPEPKKPVPVEERLVKLETSLETLQRLLEKIPGFTFNAVEENKEG